MPDYTTTIIYKIEHFDNDNLIYVGHTTNFTNRKQAHKENCLKENRKSFNYKLYKMIRDNGGWNNFKMVEVEKYPCKDKSEATHKEYEIIKELKANMNTHKSATEEDKKKKGQQYREDNKERIQKYCDDNKERIQQYRDNNKEYQKKYNKEYQTTKKEWITEKKKAYYLKKKTKVKCECGCDVIKSNLKQHQTSTSHIRKVTVEKKDISPHFCG